MMKPKLAEQKQELTMEEFLAAKTHEKLTKKISELTMALIDAEAKAELLQKLYNQSQEQLEALQSVPEKPNPKPEKKIKEK